MHTIRGQWNSRKGVMEQEHPPRWKLHHRAVSWAVLLLGFKTHKHLNSQFRKMQMNKTFLLLTVESFEFGKIAQVPWQFIHIHINLETYLCNTLMDQTAKETDFTCYSCDFTLGRQFMLFQKGTKMHLQLEILQRTLVSIKFENISLIWNGTLYRDFLLMFFHGLTSILLNVLY